MKTLFQKTILILALFVSAHAPLQAQGTAFTYQGRLNFNGAPAAGNFDLRFAVWDANTNGNQLGGTLTNSTTTVTNGLFTVTLDFGAGIFTGPDRWLEIAARTNSGGAFTLLTPRQAIAPTPYAIFAGSASNITGVINSAQLGGGFVGNAFQFTNNRNVFIGDGSGLSGVNANSLNGLQAGNFWQTTGNAGTSPTNGNFLGTTDSRPLELRVNGVRALRLEPDLTGIYAPNLLGGSAVNLIAAGVKGSSIVGGGESLYRNAIYSDWAVISGGTRNSIETNAAYSIIGAGNWNTIRTNAFDSVIGGGSVNTIEPDASMGVIGGGTQNLIQSNAFYSVISGGNGNVVQPGAYLSTMSGGGGNTIGRINSGSTIGGGEENTIAQSANSSTIGGGFSNTIQTNSADGTIGGGVLNTIESNSVASTIGGGYQNKIVAGGMSSVISGGEANTNNGQYATIPGGQGNTAGYFGFAAGRNARAVHPGAFVWSDSFGSVFSSTAINQFAAQARGGVLFNAGTNNVEIASGGLKVTGAGINTGTTAFTHLTSAATIVGNQTTINNPFCNNDPDAILIVTHNFNPGGASVLTLHNHPIGVVYSSGKWKIYNDDVSNMATNIAFNVLVIKN